MNKKTLKKIIICLLVSICLCACSSNKIDDKARPSNSGKLQVIDGQLCDKKGNPVQLQGVSTYNFCAFTYFYNEETIKQTSVDWHGNVFRFAVYVDETGGYCNGGSQSQIKSKLADCIEYATKYDMYVLIDWHVLKDRNPLKHIDDAKAFFEEMSNKYKDYDNIIYEICNEPNDTSWQDIKEYANTIIPIIRNNDPKSVIIVGNPNWSSSPDVVYNDPITGYDNLMYTYHFYAASNGQDSRDYLETYLKLGLPVFVTEYGVTANTGDAPYDFESADAWWELMNKYNVSSCMWSYSKAVEASAIVRNGIQNASNFTTEDLRDGGVWLVDKLKVK